MIFPRALKRRPTRTVSATDKDVPRTNPETAGRATPELEWQAGRKAVAQATSGVSVIPAVPNTRR
jgi:hypothetical protein